MAHFGPIFLHHFLLGGFSHGVLVGRGRLYVEGEGECTAPHAPQTPAPTNIGCYDCNVCRPSVCLCSQGLVGPLSMNAIGHTVMSPSHPHPPHPCEVQPLSASPSSRLALATTWRGPWVGVEASTRRTTSCKPWSTATDLVRVQMCSGFL